MPSTRKDLVERLVRFDGPLRQTLSALREFGWDCDEPLVTLDSASVRSVLERYISGGLTSADVEQWANALECREDLDYFRFREIIHELANPLLTQGLTPQRAQELLHAQTYAA